MLLLLLPPFVTLLTLLTTHAYTITRCLPSGHTTITHQLTITTPSNLILTRNLAHQTTTTFSLNTTNTSITLPSGLHSTSTPLQKGIHHLTLSFYNPVTPVCGTFTYTLQRQLPACPLVLPDVLDPPSPSPTPRPSNTPTPSASPNLSIASPFTRQHITPRIVGGSIPHPSLRTHMVAFIANNLFICSGSVISARWAITAAHCRISPGMLASIGGATVSTGKILTVQAAFPHQNFDTSRTDSPYDIAVVLFRESVPPGTTFIRVNTNSTVPEPGAYSRVAGYGRTVQKASQTLLQVDIPVVSMPKCRSDYSRANPGTASRLNPSIQLCAGLSTGGCDACQGDSGGPLALFDSAGHLVQIGIVSFGIGCARPNLPGVYTRLSEFEDWMRRIGAGYTRSSDGVTVFSTGSAEAAGKVGGGFSIGGLGTTQSILLLCGAALVAAILVFLAVLGISRRRRRRRVDVPAPPPGGESGANTGGYGGGGGYDNAWNAQGLYPVYGPEHQYAGYAQQPPPVADNQYAYAPPQPQPVAENQYVYTPTQPQPVARDVGVVEELGNGWEDGVVTGAEQGREVERLDQRGSGEAVVAPSTDVPVGLPKGNSTSLYPSNTVLQH